MSQVSSGDDKFLKELEASVLAILKNRKTKPADKLAAIREGVKVAAIKHKVNDGDPEKGFFDK
jgi:hypothetical protein